MSAKSIIQKLQDCDLIRLFLQFVQTHKLQYQKTSKQISYKCYQATWILINFKANGYGRTQSQAYKNALRNLLQILIQQPQYTQFFANTLPTLNNSQKQSRPSIKKQALQQSNQNIQSSHNNQINYNNHTNGNNSCSQGFPNNKKIFSSKTEGHQPIQRKGESYSKLYETYSKINQKSQSKFMNTNSLNSSNLNSSLIPSVKMTQSTNVYNTVDTSSMNTKKTIPNCQISNSITHNGININKPENNGRASLTTKNHTIESSSASEELRNALNQLSQLQQYLSSLNKQNESLKSYLKQIHQSNKNTNESHKQTNQSQQSISFKQDEENYKQNSIQFGTSNQYIQKVQILDEKQNQYQSSFMNMNKHKPQVPKLKLEILPNYHKKSQKSLNQSLLAAYNQKREQSVKKLVC